MTLPSGTVTFLFTDVEGSTRLWDTFPDDMRQALKLHDGIVTSTATSHGGHVVKHTGDGLFMAFGSANDAARAAIASQRRLADAEWPVLVGGLGVRMALHTADVEPSGDDYLSPEVNRVARIEAAGHGGQVLASDATLRLLSGDLPDGVTPVDLGEHILRGLSRPERIHQLTIDELRAVFPPLRTASVIQGVLPTFTTSFVGRTSEVEEIISLCAPGETRMVTLLGQGGIGKTRTAVEAARQLGEGSGVTPHFVTFQSLADESGITQLIGDSIDFTFDIHLSGSFPEQMQLFDRLNTQPLVMVVDNLEHLPGAGAYLEAMLEAVPELTLIATSRSRVGITAEHVFPMHGLSTEGEAAALFVQRSAAAGGQVDPSDPAVNDLVGLLGGMPLALELASAWTPMLGTAEIVAEIRRDLDFLTAEGVDVSDRHRSIRAVFEQSWRRLPEPLRDGLAHLAVFVGPFTREAAEAVGGVSLPILLQLVRDSLIRRNPIDDTYGLHPLLREFAFEKLGDSTAAAEAAYAQFFLARLMGRGPELEHGPDQVAARDDLLPDLDHIKAALGWAVVNLPDDECLEIMKVSNSFFFMHSWVELGATFGRLRQLTREAFGAEGALARQSFLYTEANRTLMLGVFSPQDPTLEADLTEVIGAAEAVGGIAHATALTSMGILTSERGQWEDSIPYFERARAVETEPHPMLNLHLGAFHGWTYVNLGRTDEARAIFDRHLAQANRDRNGIARAYLVSKLGTAADQAGDHAAALDLHHEGREIFAKANDPGGQGYTLSRLSWTHFLMGNYEMARRYGLDGLECFESMNFSWGMAMSFCRVGGAEAALGRRDDAIRHCVAGIEIASKGGYDALVHYGILCVGLALAMAGEVRDAAFLVGGSLGIGSLQYQGFGEQILDKVRARSAGEDLDAAIAAGATLTLGELAAEAARHATPIHG